MEDVKGRNIVVAVDDSDQSSYALTWCLRNIVAKHGSGSQDTIVLLYARHIPSNSTTGDSTGYLFSSDVIDTMDQQTSKIAQNVADKAKRICKDYDDHIKVEMLVENGDPRDVICEAAEKLKADLLVIGSHGYGVIKRALLGSVSSHCAQNVKCPVLIVKKPN
ncbi:universal stress protein A-like protein [Andrographis paniculata]|uniref:universal stress protein A-like protein n=1 Tax=Andrographis paniculata TaxID=175694 RepID=UPI0021E9A132|nr:universal stress protein A-like protein [Andrographis paniculata]